MNIHKISDLSQLAYGAAILFILGLSRFFVAYLTPLQVGDGTLPGTLLSLSEHLILFPIIAALPAPQWAKSAGWGWLTIDMSTDIMALNGVPPATYLALRYGGHISSALWVAAASWQGKGALRWIGWLYALNLASYSFLAAYKGSFVILFPSLVLLPLWLVLIGRLFARSGANAQALRVDSEKPAVSRNA